jgi:hypothetical protein
VAHYNTIMNQLLTHIPRHQFDTLVKQGGGDRYVKTFSTWNQFSILLYAQSSGKNSLRDIENATTAQHSKLYHLGFPGTVCRSTLADANKNRDWHMFENLFYRLLERCRSLTPQHKFKFKNPLNTLDSTVIDLCLSAYPWAKFRTTKGALKLHCQLDHAGNIPSFVVVTDGKCHDISAARDCFDLVPDSIYCFDKGYTDFDWFRRINDVGAFFVTRAKENLSYRVTGQQEVLKNKGVLKDWIIELTTFHGRQDFPQSLRLIRYYDEESRRTFEFLTNNFRLAAVTIAQIYKARWQIEAFFKWLKQNLKIKTFLGTSQNAVLTQVWVAMCYFLLLAYIKYQTKFAYSLFYLHRLIRETLLERISLIDLLNLDQKRLARLKGMEPQLCFTF